MTAKSKDNKRVITWLITGCFLLFIMVLVGGITRLTDSGLSMSNYNLITGTIPPLNDAEWQDAFEHYKQFPEYNAYNTGFELEDFKAIYFWEWFHRVLGRLIGLVFIIPFIYFLFTKQLTKATIKKCIGLLFLGGFQGFLGWFMVKSGLIDQPDVSHFRLATHLTTAFITFALTLWVALDLIYPIKKPALKSMKNWIIAGISILLIQIIYGGFVAGLKAGLLHNHWPMMNENMFIHDTVYLLEPFYKNLIVNPSGIQFIHRALAYLVVLFVIIIWFKARKFDLNSTQKLSVNILVLLVIVQFALGVYTILYKVPLLLGLAHQIGAFFLISAMVFALHRFSK